MTYQGLDWIHEIPKLDLHRHLTGCITKELLTSLFLKYHENLESSPEFDVNNFFSFSNSEQFFQAHRKVRSLLQDLNDFTLLAETINNQLKTDNIIYTELLFSPQIFISQGLSLPDMLSTLYKVFKNSSSKINLIIEFSRSRGDLFAERVFNELLILLDNDYAKIIKGISLGGDEINYSANPFRNIFAKAREMDLKVIAHAGEWADAHSVWNVIHELQIQRLIHGIRSVQDKDLINYLINNDIPLDVSITSNYATGAVASQEIHPIVDLNKLGVKILLSTDMPGYFNITLSSEFKKLVKANFSTQEIINIIRNTISSSLTTIEEKTDLYQQLDQFIEKKNL